MNGQRTADALHTALWEATWNAMGIAAIWGTADGNTAQLPSTAAAQQPGDGHVPMAERLFLKTACLSSSRHHIAL